MSLKTYLAGNVSLQYYRKGNLWYQTENGFFFPVPTDDTGDADFFPQDKAMLFMRWIKRELMAQGIMSDKPPQSKQPQVDVREIVKDL